MKKLFFSSALAAIVAIPALGIEVYSNEEKEASVELYGSLRGYVGGGGTLDKIQTSLNNLGDGNALIGFQTNSHFGINYKYGKLFTQVEFGLHETGFLSAGGGPGLRKVFGTYDFGSAGKLTFGKLNTPSLEGGFQTDFNNNDAGGNGFGSVATGGRKLQVQYSHSGVTVAIIADEAASGITTATVYSQSYADNARLNPFPRIALSYEGKIGEQGKFKVAATYKWYGENNAGGGISSNNTTAGLVGEGQKANVHAGNLLVAAKVPFGSAYLSTIFNYGINGHLYNEQQTSYSEGVYGYQSLNALAGLHAQRAGLLLEGGAKINDTIGVAAGVGYQATFNGIYQRGHGGYNSGLQAIHGYKIYANLPINVAKGFQVVPQIAFYDTIENLRLGGNLHHAALLGLIRLKYDF